MERAMVPSSQKLLNAKSIFLRVFFQENEVRDYARIVSRAVSSPNTLVARTLTRIERRMAKRV